MHAPDVMLRVLGSGIDKAADARAKLAAILTKHGVKTPVEVPDISTADKAWKVMGIDIEKERQAKKNFRNCCTSMGKRSESQWQIS